MIALTLPAHPPFISSAELRPLGQHADIMLLEAAFDCDHFDESLFSLLQIPLPPTLNRAVKKRRAEYLVSRYYLQQAMQHFGITPFLLCNDAARAPIWPTGICGSLSHSHRRVCALLTRRQDVMVGIDCEQIMSAQAASEMADIIITPAEKQLLASINLPFACVLTVIFSLKESLYKAIYPRLQQFMDFSSAEVIDCSSDLQQVRLRLTHRFSAEFYAGREFNAGVQIACEHVMTWVIAT